MTKTSIHRSSPVHSLKGGERLIYCPWRKCGWTSPNTAYLRCPQCNAELRYAFVSKLGGVQLDVDYRKYAIKLIDAEIERLRTLAQ